MREICTIYFYQEEDTKIYTVFLGEDHSMVQRGEEKMILPVTIKFVDLLKHIGYTNSEPVYWDYESYCYHNWDITDIMNRNINNFPDTFEFCIGDEDNGVVYND